MNPTDQHTTFPRSILQQYTLPAATRQVDTINNGLINNTWKITLTNDDAYILQMINTAVFTSPEHIAHNIDLLKTYTSTHFPGYLLIAPLPANDGEYLVKMNDRYYRLFHFVKGSHTITAVENRKQAYEAAKQFGLFTRLLNGVDTSLLKPVLPDFHNLQLRYDQFQQALQHGNVERIAASKTLINFLKDKKDIVNTFISILNDHAFKLRVTHHDTKISNVLFNDHDDGLCVIDLDTVMPGYFISDVGDMMRTYLSPANEEERDLSKIRIDQDYFSAIVEGYGSEMKDKLTVTEKKHFVYAGKFMVYMQALRFLTDHLNNDIYYGAKYEGHNLVRAENQARLLQCIIEKEKALENIVEQYLY